MIDIETLKTHITRYPAVGGCPWVAETGKIEDGETCACTVCSGDHIALLGFEAVLVYVAMDTTLKPLIWGLKLQSERSKASSQRVPRLWA